MLNIRNVLYIPSLTDKCQNLIIFDNAQYLYSAIELFLKDYQVPQEHLFPLGLFRKTPQSQTVRGFPLPRKYHLSAVPTDLVGDGINANKTQNLFSHK